MKSTPSPSRLPVFRERVLSPALSALLLSFCFPFASAWWLAWIALVPLYFSLWQAQGNIRAGFVSGMVFGLVLHIIGMFWMSKLGVVPYVLLSIIESGGFAIFGAIVAPLLVRLPSWARPLLFAALYTCLEYGRSQGSVAFPWFLLAATQVPCLSIVQIVSITGQWGLTFAVALTNGLLWEAWAVQKLGDKVSFRWLAGFAVYVPIALAILGWFALVSLDKTESGGAAKETSTRTIAIVQGNVGKISENASSEDIDEYRWNALNTYLQMTRFAVGTTKDLAFVLWPETVVPGYLLHDPTLQFQIASLARSTSTNLLVGTMDTGNRDERFNAVVHLDPRGEVRHNYAKQRLVPMGEFFLFRRELGSIYEKYDVPNDDLTPGRAPGVFDVGEGDSKTRVGMVICYESVFPYISRNRVKKGAQILVQSTSDETFDETPNPQQHADFAVLRAVETRRSFIRAGATGLSEIVDAGGRVRRKIPSLKAGTLIDTVALRQGETFFVRFGDWFVGLCEAITAFGVIVALLTKRPVPVPAILPTPSSAEDALPE